MPGHSEQNFGLYLLCFIIACHIFNFFYPNKFKRGNFKISSVLGGVGSCRSSTGYAAPRNL